MEDVLKKEFNWCCQRKRSAVIKHGRVAMNIHVDGRGRDYELGKFTPLGSNKNTNGERWKIVLFIH